MILLKISYLLQILNYTPVNVRTPKYLIYFYTDFHNWSPKKLKMNSNQIDQVPNITQNEESSNTVPNENSHTFAAKSYAEPMKTPHRSHHSKGNIFSIDELFEIFSKAVLDLQKYTSKKDHLTVIMQICIEDHLPNDE